MLEYYNKYNTPGIELELEIRTIIPAYLVEHLNYETITIPYYRSTNHPSLTIRTIKTNNINKINTKELIEKVTVDNISIVLSLEKYYSRFPDSLIPTLTRTIKRTIINNNPYTVISYYNNAYFLEIEYNNTNVDNAISILDNYKHKYWPSKKPIDAYTAEIIVKLMSEQYYLSPKADGEHALFFIHLDKWMCLFDNGNYLGDILTEYSTVYEGEWMGSYLLCYDTFMYENKDIRTEQLEIRLKCRKESNIVKLKDIMHIKDYESFKYAYNKLKNNKYTTDGWILSPSNYNDTIYKSKPIPTVDLQYIDGYLYLANELYSKRTVLNDTILENGKIYEFTLEMKPIKIREDKIIPNYRMPVDVDPIGNIYNCHGLPLLRFHHNYIKLQLLKTSSNGILLDVGSGYGGDVKKWLKCNYSKIYAVDPNLNLRTTNPKIVHLRCEIDKIPDNIIYDNISIFFVPWNDVFLKYMIKAKNVLLILMTNPKEMKNKEAIIKIRSNTINIQFPNTVTANNIEEKKVNINKINKYMSENNYIHTQFKCKIEWCSKVEDRIAAMYTYHMYEKNN